MKCLTSCVRNTNYLEELNKLLCHILNETAVSASLLFGVLRSCPSAKTCKIFRTAIWIKRLVEEKKLPFRVPSDSHALPRYESAETTSNFDSLQKTLEASLNSAGDSSVCANKTVSSSTSSLADISWYIRWLELRTANAK